MTQSLASGTIIAALAGAAAAQPCAWDFVPTPPVAGNWATVFDMDGSAPDDIWLVGEYNTGWPLPAYWNYAIHFDGERWTETPVPSIDTLGSHNGLAGVLALSKTEALAVGNTKRGPQQEIGVFRWDGSAWEIEDIILLGGASVADLDRAGSDIWAVGIRPNDAPPPATTTLPLALRRTSSGWEEHPVPPLAALGRTNNGMSAVHGISADDAWGVGSAKQTYAPGPSFNHTMYAVHWDGSAWTLDQTMPRTEHTILDDVVMVASDDVWAVGYATGDGTNQPLIMHYDGAAWTRVNLPRYPGRGALLRGVVARAADDVYALGVIDHDPGDDVALILHYDGTGWSEVAPPATDGRSEQVMCAALVGPREGGEIWGAGLYVKDGRPFTMRQRCADCRPDLTGDGALDFFDFLAFQNLFAAGDLRADFTGDGALDFFDFLAFQNEFAAGCA